MSTDDDRCSSLDPEECWNRWDEDNQAATMTVSGQRFCDYHGRQYRRELQRKHP